MFLRNRSLLVKLVKTPKEVVTVDEMMDDILEKKSALRQFEEDVEWARDIVVETVATVAVIVVGVKVVDALCRIGVGLATRR